MRFWLIVALVLAPLAARAQSIGTSSSPTPINLLQVAGSPIALGQNWGINSLPVAIAADQSPLPGNLVKVGGFPLALGSQSASNSLPVAIAWNQLPLKINQVSVNGQAIATGGVVGSQIVEQGCAGQTVASTSVTPFDTNGASTSIQLVAGVAAKKVYICSIDIVAGAADNVALVEGTGSLCATSTTGMAGGPTAARGWNFAANGGLTKGNGQGVVYKTATAADAVCLLFSAAVQASGSITWAQF